MPLTGATTPAYPANAANPATSQPRPIAATDPGAAREGSRLPLSADLKASRTLTSSPDEFRADFRTASARRTLPRPGRASGWCRPAGAGSANDQRTAHFAYAARGAVRVGTGGNLRPGLRRLSDTRAGNGGQ